METFVLICVVALLAFSLLIAVLRRYRRCPSDKIMVVYGNVGSNSDGTPSAYPAARPSYGP
jgi:flotillin